MAIKCAQMWRLKDNEVLRCSVPPGVGSMKQICVRVNDLHGIGTFTYSPPMVLDTSVVTTVGGELVVTGSNFGSDAELVLVEWFCAATEAWEQCPVKSTEVLVAHTIIRCVVGQGSGLRNPVRVSVAGLSGAGVFAYAAPLVVDIRPVSAARGVVEIVGLNFGSKVEDVPSPSSEPCQILRSFRHTPGSIHRTALPAQQRRGSRARAEAMATQVVATHPLPTTVQPSEHALGWV